MLKDNPPLFHMFLIVIIILNSLCWANICPQKTMEAFLTVRKSHEMSVSIIDMSSIKKFKKTFVLS